MGMVTHQFMNSCMMTIAEATNSNSNEPINRRGRLEVSETSLHWPCEHLVSWVAIGGLKAIKVLQWSPI